MEHFQKINAQLLSAMANEMKAMAKFVESKFLTLNEDMKKEFQVLIDRQKNLQQHMLDLEKTINVLGIKLYTPHVASTSATAVPDSEPVIPASAPAPPTVVDPVVHVHASVPTSASDAYVFVPAPPFVPTETPASPSLMDDKGGEEAS